MLRDGYEPEMGLGRNGNGMASLVKFVKNHRRCVFQGRKMRGVATNVYLRKTSEKPKWEKGQRSTYFENEGSGIIYARGRY